MAVSSGFTHTAPQGCGLSKSSTKAYLFLQTLGVKHGIYIFRTVFDCTISYIHLYARDLVSTEFSYLPGMEEISFVGANR